jgi:hypothetical protein
VTGTQGPAVIPTPHSISSQEAPASRPSPSPRKIQSNGPSSPKFKWGDIIEDPNGARYTILEGKPEISGSYTVYKIKNCPCVQLLFLDVPDTDGRFRKVGTQNPATICNESILRILREPEDTCDMVEPDSLEGNGNSRKSISVPSDGRFIFTGSHSGEKNFIVKIVDRDGEVVVSLFNTAGAFYGAATAYLEEGDYYLDVRASGSWKIEIAPV